MTYADAYVRCVADIPKIPHYALFVNDSVHIPGDERSRTNPGHGYPAEDRVFLSYEAYLTRDKLLAVLKERQESPGHRQCYACKVNPVTVLVSTTIALDE